MGSREKVWKVPRLNYSFSLVEVELKGWYEIESQKIKSYLYLSWGTNNHIHHILIAKWFLASVINQYNKNTGNEHPETSVTFLRKWGEGVPFKTTDSRRGSGDAILGRWDRPKDQEQDLRSKDRNPFTVDEAWSIWEDGDTGQVDSGQIPKATKSHLKERGYFSGPCEEPCFRAKHLLTQTSGVFRTLTGGLGRVSKRWPGSWPH